MLSKNIGAAMNGISADIAWFVFMRSSSTTEADSRFSTINVAPGRAQRQCARSMRQACKTVNRKESIMEPRTRVIDLTGPRKRAVVEPMPGMLIWVRRDKGTDLHRVDVFIGGFQLCLERGNDGQDPEYDSGWEFRIPSREVAIALAREFVSTIGYTGRVRWKVGENGIISDEPRT